MNIFQYMLAACLLVIPTSARQTKAKARDSPDSRFHNKDSEHGGEGGGSESDENNRSDGGDRSDGGSSTTVTRRTTLTETLTSDPTSTFQSVSSSGSSSSISENPTSTLDEISASISSTSSATPALAYSSSTDPGLRATPTTMATISSEESTNRRTLVVTLSAVFGVLGLALILGAFYLVYLYRTGRRPFSHRGATPINDDEIATWRRSATSTIRGGTLATGFGFEKEPMPMMPEVALSPLTHNSGWEWSMTSSPISTTRPGFTSGLTMPDTPSFLARAPNARAGLTDETVPGEDPFILPVKRQSSRLSKAPPGHGRSKSRRSSMSGKSIVSVRSGNIPLPAPRTLQSNTPTWYDPDDEARWRRTRNDDYPNSPTVLNHVPGGLSPRPVSSIRPGTGRTFA
ncbi:hypothetical protein PVAG01_01549 [Phlyctema vagabunda]|uniref:Uncharacterized protein n=1 Tax=Phlyctema vagabunda TaxID=108571 RepID=A0ABR4PXF4_9HELO